MDEVNIWQNSSRLIEAAVSMSIKMGEHGYRVTLISQEQSNNRTDIQLVVFCLSKSQMKGHVPVFLKCF